MGRHWTCFDSKSLRPNRSSANMIICRLSEKETDPHDKLMPTVNYLQRLGPEHLEQIFEHSRWVFEQDRDIAFEVTLSHHRGRAWLSVVRYRSSPLKKPSCQRNTSRTS